MGICKKLFGIVNSFIDNTRFTWGDILDNSKTMSELVGKNQFFVDNNKELLSYLSDEVDKISTQYKSKGKFKDIVDYQMSIINEFKFDMSRLDGISQNDIDIITKNTKEFAGVYLREGYNIQQIAKASMGSGKVLSNIYTDTVGSLKPALISKYGKVDFAENLKADVLSEGYKFADTRAGAIVGKGGTIDDFVSDMSGTTLYNTKLKKVVANVSEISRMGKYFLGVGNGSNLLGNSGVVGTHLYLAGKRGMEGLLGHDTIDLLMTKYNILKSESRADTLALSQLQTGDGAIGVSQWIGNALKIIPGGKYLETIVKGGWHSLYDIGMNQNITRLAIADALSRRGWNAWNIGSFYKALEEGKVSQEELQMITKDATLYFKDFFTNVSSTSITRNAFSRYYLLNFMQGYVVSKIDTVKRGIQKFSKGIVDGKISTWGEFVDHLWTENEELRNLLFTTLYTAKTAYYITDKTQASEPADDKMETIMQYMKGSNDFLSSLETSFITRLYSAPFDGLAKYTEYNKQTGSTSDFVGGVSVMALNTLGEITSSLLRQVSGIKPMLSYATELGKTGNADWAFMALITDLDKLTSGLGRFNLLPGTDQYGIAFREQNNDWYGSLTLTLNDTNKDRSMAQKLNDVAFVDQVLTDKAGWLQRQLMYLPIISSFGKKTEATSKYIQQLILDDGIMKQIYAGEFPRDIFDADTYKFDVPDEKGYKKNLANRLYDELLDFDYTNIDNRIKKYLEDGKYQNAKGMNQTKEDVFISYIWDKFGRSIVREKYNEIEDKQGMSGKQLVETLGDFQTDTIKQKALYRMLLGAEAESPGSSRLILSTFVNQEFYNGLKKITGNEDNKYFKLSEVPQGTQDEFKKELVKKYYPYLYEADKTSWYRLATERLQQVNPEVFGSIAKDTKLSGFVNNLAFVDMLIQEKGKERDVDAVWMKNALSYGAKYIQDPTDRLNVIKYSMSRIDKSVDSIDTALAMKSGVVAANIDFINKMKDDPDFYAQNKDVVDTVVNQVWGTNNQINKIGSEYLRHSITEDLYNNYRANNGKEYNPSKYANKNYKQWEQTSPKISRASDYGKGGTSSGYSPKNSYNKSSSSYVPDHQILVPKLHTSYVKVEDYNPQAITKGLTGQTEMKSYPGEGMKTFRIQSKSGRLPSAAKKSIGKAKVSRARYGTIGGLPGSIVDTDRD